MSSARSTFLHYLGEHRPRLVVAGLVIALAGFVAVIPPRFLGEIVDALGAGTTAEDLTRLAALLVLFSAIQLLLSASARYLVLDASRRAEYRMRNDLFAHLQRMHLAYFQHQRVGDLMARMTNDLAAVRMMMGPAILNAANTLTMVTFAIAAMLALSARLTLLAGILMPLVSLTFWWVGARVGQRFERLQAQFGELSTKAQENFSGIRVVKAFAQEEAEIGGFAAVNAEYARRAVGLARVQGLLWPAMSLIVGMAVLLALYVGGADAIRGELSVGQLVQFVAYVYLLAWPMIALGWVSNLVQQGWASLRRLQEMFDARPAIADRAETVARLIRGEVEFDRVSFAYDGTAVLREVSFRVPAGGSLAIVGPTGSGKSTLVNLIPRLFEPQRGRVLVDGVDARHYPLAALRRAVGYVPQETFLFSVPLRENVSFGVEGALDEDRLWWAGDVSQLNTDVEDFPARYDTMIGERGVTLSGGQKQRAAIARAIAKDPRMLILDDALSAVDTYTEAEILKRLRGVLRDRTSIIVAHRISTVKDADEILVLDDGRIVERGTHLQLLELDGLYAQMYRRQLLEEELEVDIEREEHERRVAAERGPAEEPVIPPRRLLGGDLPEGTP